MNKLKQTEKPGTSNSKPDAKDNLVSSSMMLVNNPGSGTIDSYFPDPRYTSHTPTCTVTSEDYSSAGQQRSIPWPYQYYYHYEPPQTHSMPECLCKKVPPQETFLHQILMGKGYKNDQMFINTYIKQEVDYHYYGCCYDYPYGYGYPVYQ